MSSFNPERGRNEDEGHELNFEIDKKKQAIDAIQAKIEDLRSYGKHGETNIKRYEKLRTEINKGNQNALNEVTLELGLEEVVAVKQEIIKPKIKPQTKEQLRKTEENIERYN